MAALAETGQQIETTPSLEVVTTSKLELKRQKLPQQLAEMKLIQERANERSAVVRKAQELSRKEKPEPATVVFKNGNIATNVYLLGIKNPDISVPSMIRTMGVVTLAGPIPGGEQQFEAREILSIQTAPTD